MAINEGERESGEKRLWLPLQREIFMVQIPSFKLSPFKMSNWATWTVKGSASNYAFRWEFSLYLWCVFCHKL
jgi:hypothetical protein